VGLAAHRVPMKGFGMHSVHCFPLSQASLGASRVALGVAPQSSHRSGLARLRHPARRATDSHAEPLSASVTGTGSQGSRSLTGFPPAGPRRGAPFPPPGPVGYSSPSSAVLWGAPIPCEPSRQPALVGRLSLPLRVRLSSSLRSSPTPACGQGPFGCGRPPQAALRGSCRASQVPGEP
jgi:hypothetical protein